MATFTRYLQQGEAEFDFLPSSAVDDTLKFLDQDIREKEGRLERASSSVVENDQRVKVMNEHLKNVQQELTNTQQLCEAKLKEIETEDHLKQLAEREAGRMIQVLKEQERQAVELQDRMNSIHNSIFQGNEQMDKFKVQMNWNQEELEQWALASKQKEEDNLVLSKYAKADQAKIRELSQIADKLHREVTQTKVVLENEVTETQTGQIELDKTAEDFRLLHNERQELVQQFEASTQAIEKRNEAIEAAGQRLVEQTEQVNEREAELKSKKEFHQQQIAENEGQEKKLKDVERAVQKFRGMLTQEKDSLTRMQDEVEIVRSTLAKTASSLQMRRAEVQSIMQVVEDKRGRLELMRKKGVDTRKRLEAELAQTSDLEQKAMQVDRINKEEQARLRAAERELSELKNEMFRKSQELFDLRRKEANFIAEISGAHSADRNLRDKIKQLDEQSQKQQEMVYDADFQLQMMERKVSRAQGEYHADEKDKLNKQIKDLENQLVDAQGIQKMLGRQVVKVHDDVRGSHRRVTKLKEERDGVSERLHELTLANDSVGRALKSCVRRKEEAIVQHDLMRLEVRKLRDALNARADEVHGLENRKFQIQKSMEERALQIKAQKEALRADLKMADEDKHRVTLELRDREMKLETMQKKYELLVDKMSSELGSENERKSPAYYVVLRAQEREELQRKGDVIDAKIQKAEREVRALESTLAKINSKNQRFRSSFSRTEGTSIDAAQRDALQQRLDAAVSRRRAAQGEAEQLQNDVAEMQRSLGNLMQEVAGFERMEQGISDRTMTLQKEINDLQAKADRAGRAEDKARSQHRQEANAVSGTSTTAEKDIDLQARKDALQQLILALVAATSERPELAQKVQAMFAERGVEVPSRPPSSAGSDVGSVRSSSSRRSNASRTSQGSARSAARPVEITMAG